MLQGLAEASKERWLVAGSLTDRRHGRLSYVIECRMTGLGMNWSAQVRLNGNHRQDFNGLVATPLSGRDELNRAVRDQVETLIRDRVDL